MGVEWWCGVDLRSFVHFDCEFLKAEKADKADKADEGKTLIPAFHHLCAFRTDKLRSRMGHGLVFRGSWFGLVLCKWSSPPSQG